MVLGVRCDDAPRGFVLVVAVVGNPPLSYHEAAKAVPPGLVGPGVGVPVVVEPAPGVVRDFEGLDRSRILGLPELAHVPEDLPVELILHPEGVCGGPERDHRLARLEVAIDRLHLLVGKDPPAGLDEHQVGVVQVLGPGDVGVDVRIDDPGLGIDGKQHGATEAVVLGEHAAQHGQALFRPVLLVAGNQHDMPAVACPVAGLVADEMRLVGSSLLVRRRLGPAARGGQEQAENRQEVKRDAHGSACQCRPCRSRRTDTPR